MVRPVEAAHLDHSRRKLPLQIRAEIPFRARSATKDVEAKRMILGKGVAGKMRFCEQTKARDAAGYRKLVPIGVAYRMQLQSCGQLREQRVQPFRIGKSGPVATVRFDHPFAAAHGLLLGASAFGAELSSARKRLTAIDAELGGGFATRRSKGRR